ncbi:MAG TPA: hypothetical protein V6C72_05470, partial [Chroococcales cyanobacterium]
QQMPDTIHTIMTTAKEALVSGIDLIFVIAAVMIAMALVLNLFLPEVPLRKDHVKEVVSPSDAHSNPVAVFGH